MRSKQLLGGLIVAAAMVVGLATPAHASSIVFDLTGSSSDGSVGNQRVYTSGGLTMYATAWYWTGSSYAAAGLGRYSSGLGVCNSAEDGSSFPCDSPSHTVDNNGQWDFVLFTFSSPVDLTSVHVNEIQGDTDVSYRLGKIAGLVPSSLSLPAALTSFNWIDNSGDGSRTVTLTSPTNDYNFLFFGADRGTDDRDDYFKINSLTVDYTLTRETQETPVPEPASLLLMGTGLAFAAARIRKARQS